MSYSPTKSTKELYHNPPSPVNYLFCHKIQSATRKKFFALAFHFTDVKLTCRVKTYNTDTAGYETYQELYTGTKKYLGTTPLPDGLRRMAGTVGAVQTITGENYFGSNDNLLDGNNTNCGEYLAIKNARMDGHFSYNMMMALNDADGTPIDSTPCGGCRQTALDINPANTSTKIPINNGEQFIYLGDALPFSPANSYERRLMHFMTLYPNHPLTKRAIATDYTLAIAEATKRAQPYDLNTYKNDTWGEWGAAAIGASGQVYSSGGRNAHFSQNLSPVDGVIMRAMDEGEEWLRMLVKVHHEHGAVPLNGRELESLYFTDMQNVDKMNLGMGGDPKKPFITTLRQALPYSNETLEARSRGVFQIHGTEKRGRPQQQLGQTS